MKRKVLFFLMALLSGHVHLSAQQTSDVFSISGGHIMSNAKFFSEETVKDTIGYIPSGIPVYENAEDKTGGCRIAYIDTAKSETDEIGMDGFEQTQLYEGVRIYGGSGTLLLEQWSYSSIQDVSNITMGASSNRYLPVKLDSKTMALIFGGSIYETGDDSPEMIIIIVRGNEAKLVFDRPAMVYAYTPEPNFSIEYVEQMDWGNYENCDVFTPNSKTIASQTKYKIWKEGNMLKYKSWK